MEGIIIVALFSLQLISFFFIVILFAKLNKFKELEKKQEQIVEEMDAGLGAYLMEMKEENDRLIQQLSSMPKREDVGAKEEHKLNKATMQLEVPKIVSSTTASNVYKANIEKLTQLEESAMLTPNSTIAKVEPLAPSAIERTSIAAKESSIQQEALLQEKELSYEEMVVEMYKSGHSVEDIAKNLNKGKTEIELLIKFHT